MRNIANTQVNNTNTNPWPGYHNRNQGDQSSVSSDTGSASHWKRHWGERECSACSQQGHDAENCPAKRDDALLCDRYNKGTHCNNMCTQLHGASTPRHVYFNHPPPHTNDNCAIPPVSHYTNRPSSAHSNGGSLHDITQMFLTHLAENRTQADRQDHKKDLLVNISSFDGKDKKSCLMWMNQLVQTTTHSQIPLRELLAAKAGPIVMSVVQSFLFDKPEATDEQVRKLIFEHFSNVGTQQEAYHHSKRMKQADDDSLIAYNTEYVAVHEATYNITKENQTGQTIQWVHIKQTNQENF